MRSVVCVCLCVWVALLRCVLLGVAVEVGGQWIHTPSNAYKEENEECRRDGDSVWLCKRDRDCPGARAVLRAGGKLVTCSWKGFNTHIICCPPEEPTRNRIAISGQRCLDYQKQLCPGPLYGRLSKRNLIPENQKNTLDGDEGKLVLSAIGGKPTRAKEFPNMENQTNALEDGERTFVMSAIGGKPTKAKEYPNMALIGYGDAPSISWQCGGSLISKRFVLSAAHCSLTSYGLARWVRLGDLDISSYVDDARPQQFEIVERVAHSGYRAPAFYNDIVLFRLDRAAVFDPYVRPACLHESLADPTGVGIATGWGRNESNGPRSSSLVKVDLKFLPSEECRQTMGTVDRYLPAGLDTRTMLCAGEPGKDTCQGDSGGPLMLADRGGSCLDKQVGITSFGPKDCGMSPSTGAYVRVAHFVPWIESVVWPE